MVVERDKLWFALPLFLNLYYSMMFFEVNN